MSVVLQYVHGAGVNAALDYYTNSVVLQLITHVCNVLYS